MVGLADVELPAKFSQALGQFARVVENLIDLILSSIIESASQHSCVAIWQLMIFCGGSLIVSGVHEENTSAGGEAISYQLPKFCEAFGWDVGKPEAEEHSVELFGGSPFEQV